MATLGLSLQHLFLGDTCKPYSTAVWETDSRKQSGREITQEATAQVQARDNGSLAKGMQWRVTVVRLLVF